MNFLKNSFEKMTSEQKKYTIWIILGCLVVGLGVGGYKMTHRGGGEQARIVAREKPKEIVLDPTMIEQTSLREQRKEIDALRKELEDINKKQAEAEKETARLAAQDAEAAQPEQMKIPSAEEIAQGSATGERKFPPPSPRMMQGQNQQGIPGQQRPGMMGQQYGEPVPPQPEETLVGGIGMNHNNNATKAAEEKKEVPDKKKARSIYLPPSFMEAELLTGFDAATSGSGNNSPEPILLRIQTPAQLPNDIKANLKGCFIIAEGVGRLDKERADVRTTSLSCISKKGASVIDTKIKGFVTDSDGKVGLSGRVVSRMGSAVARSFVAGVFGGAGEALQSSSLTQSTSALGTASTVDSAQIGKNALGSGIAEGANALQKFYLDLAKQATPVVEVAPTKAITVVLSEGVEVQFKEIPQAQNDF
ncbi:MAG: hypothetical protein ACD_74C00155G0004 [uncultured bacterium]|nr:MAG: hypothetical protein ACD_74C00155G0004 [uncultured bacterium]